MREILRVQSWQTVALVERSTNETLAARGSDLVLPKIVHSLPQFEISHTTLNQYVQMIYGFEEFYLQLSASSILESSGEVSIRVYLKKEDKRKLLHLQYLFPSFEEAISVQIKSEDAFNANDEVSLEIELVVDELNN